MNCFPSSGLVVLSFAIHLVIGISHYITFIDEIKLSLMLLILLNIELIIFSTDWIRQVRFTGFYSAENRLQNIKDSHDVEMRKK